MRLKDADPSVPGAHHLTRENISYEIAFLKEIEEGAGSVHDVDWRTTSGVLARQLEWLLSHFDQ